MMSFHFHTDMIQDQEYYQVGAEKRFHRRAAYHVGRRDRSITHSLQR